MRRLLGSLFASAASLRVAAYERGLLRRARLGGPVVSVGNLSVGGSGKTPVVRLVAEVLREAGAPVAVLSRGYGGRFRGDALVVSDGRAVTASAEEAGDEPVMLARALPGVVVAVGRRRDVVGRAVEARFGRRVHVLDDGFQHLRLARDLDLVCLDVADLDDRPLPAGRLRERPAALSRASFVLLTRVEAASEDELQGLEARVGPARVLRVRRRVLAFRTLDGAPAATPSRAFLLAAIARPVAAAAGRRRGTRRRGRGPRVLPRSPPVHGGRGGRGDGSRRRSRGGRSRHDSQGRRSAADGRPGLAAGGGARDRGRDRSPGPRSASRETPRLRAEVRLSRATRHRLEAALAAGVSVVVRRVPRRAVLAVGGRLGLLWARLDARHLAIARDNLRRAFPEWDEARVDRTARGVYAHFGSVILDLLWMEGRPAGELLALADLDGVEHLQNARAAGRGVVAPSAHFGNWEIQAIASVPLVGNVASIARPLDNPALDLRLVALRTSTGNAVFYKQKALAHVMKTIREGGIVAVLIDQNVQERDGIFVRFFGRSASTTTVAAAVALKTGCAIVPVRCALQPNGRYLMSYGPPVEWSASGRRDEDVAALTQHLTTIVEGWVRDRPEQWLWLHRRWKTQPSAAAAASAPATETPGTIRAAEAAGPGERP